MTRTRIKNGIGRLIGVGDSDRLEIRRWVGAWNTRLGYDVQAFRGVPCGRNLYRSESPCLGRFRDAELGINGGARNLLRRLVRSGVGGNGGTLFRRYYDIRRRCRDRLVRSGQLCHLRHDWWPLRRLGRRGQLCHLRCDWPPRRLAWIGDGGLDGAFNRPEAWPRGGCFIVGCPLRFN